MEPKEIKTRSYDEVMEYIRDKAAVAELKPAARIDKDRFAQTKTLQEEDYQFIRNVSDGETTAVCSDGYQLVQHSDFFAPGIKAMREVIPHPRTIELIDNRSRVDLFVKPEGENLANVGDISTGVQLSNSFDKSISATLSPYLERMVCTNGMILTKTLGKRSRIHYGTNFDIDKLMEDAENVIDRALVQIPQLIEDAVDRIVEEPEFELEEAGFGTDYREDIMNQFSQQSRYGENGWQLYDSSTYVIENLRRDVSQRTRERNHRKAERILRGETVNPN